ncbi:MAG TPA: DNA translocase FtsK [Solirubrobacteraceae bacterium]|nr:DNA translocase FtsK [Solirubrobacteraceae bacterium]
MAATRKRTTARSAKAARTPARRGRGGRQRRRGRPRGIAGLGLSLPAALPRLPALDQRERDVLGLALAALGVFIGFVLYGGWHGGRLGHWTVVGLGWAVGGARELAPVALVAGGGILLLRPVLPALRPLRTGSICLFAAVTLALAAGTLGVSSGPVGAHATHNAGSWSSSHLQSHGGAVGEALYQGTHRLVESLGVDILVVFLFLVGVTLLTGASLATLIRATGSGLIDTTRLVRSRVGAREPSGLAGATSARSTMPAGGPPEPGPGQLVVRATHVEAPSQDALADDDPWHADPPDESPAAGEGDVVSEAGGTGERAEASEHEELPGVARTDSSPTHPLTPQGRLRESVTGDPDFKWKLPDAARLLTRSTGEQARPDTAGQERTATSLVEALGHFGVDAKVIGTVAGPHITRYELRLAPGTKVGKVAQLKDDLAYALAATDIRILAPIPGKQAVGVEVPNARRKIVRLGDVFQDPPKDWSPLTVWLGKDVAGKAIGADLAKMPHLLVAGTTGAGKSGAINAMLSSVLLRATPHEVRLVLVDPKQVELNHYESIPHLLTPVITSPRMAANALQNLVKEMEQRYGIMSLARTRGLIELNQSRAKRDEAPLPYILCVIDELADLMMVAPADVEDSIIRLAQKARAVGIHLVLATQSPRVDVITGMIKANVPSRIAFAVSSQTDSRVILDQNGAESLLGQGDMLFSPVGSSRLQRIQGAYIDEAQIAGLTDLWRRQGKPELREELLEEVEHEGREGSGSGDELDPDEDPLLRDAIVLVAEMQTASTSMLQRRLRLGYTRAGRMIDMLERRGVISGYEGSKPRQVLITEADLPRVLEGLESRSAPATTLSD